MCYSAKTFISCDFDDADDGVMLHIAHALPTTAQYIVVHDHILTFTLLCILVVQNH